MNTILFSPLNKLLDNINKKQLLHANKTISTCTILYLNYVLFTCLRPKYIILVNPIKCRRLHRHDTCFNFTAYHEIWRKFTLQYLGLAPQRIYDSENFLAWYFTVIHFCHPIALERFFGNSQDCRHDYGTS